MAVMTATQLANKCIDVAKNYKTLYVMGCFGAPMTEANKQRYIAHHSYNARTDRKPMIKAATADTFGFDCVCLIKGLLWGWNGNKSAVYGGAGYSCKGVPDIDADAMIRVCSDVSTDFSDIEVGEVVWMVGHIGVYIGNGLAVECTPKWGNRVQITAVANIGSKSGYNARRWTKHGKLPYVSYPKTNASTKPQKSLEEVAKEVIKGLWGSGTSRKQKLTAAGYNYSAVQKKVNELMSTKSNLKSVDEVAKEVIRGLWGSGAARKQKLTAAGYDYSAVQKRVNELLK